MVQWPTILEGSLSWSIREPDREETALAGLTIQPVIHCTHSSGAHKLRQQNNWNHIFTVSSGAQARKFTHRPWRAEQVLVHIWLSSWLASLPSATMLYAVCCCIGPGYAGGCEVLLRHICGVNSVFCTLTCCVTLYNMIREVKYRFITVMPLS